MIDYNLLAIYREKGDVAKTKEYAEKILKLWPQDTSVKSLFDGIQTQ